MLPDRGFARVGTMQVQAIMPPRVTQESERVSWGLRPWEAQSPKRARRKDLPVLFLVRSPIPRWFWFRYFRNPCDRDPPTRNFKNSKFFKNSLKILNVHFQGTNLLLGNERLLLGMIGVFGVFGIYFFVAGGFGGSVGRGVP